MRVEIAREPDRPDTAEELAPLANIAPRRVLLAEDNPINALYIERILGAADHSVTTVNNGNEVLDALRAEAYDVVFMDVQMPGMDGIETTEKARAARDLRVPSTIPIVALTANAMKGDAERFLAEGMTAYIAKPGSPEDLARVLLRCSVGTGPP